METAQWYEMLIRPSWAPPAEVFGPVWGDLYVLIAVSFGYVAYLYFRRRVSGGVALPFALNLIFNLAFSPIQFGLQNNLLAAADILLILATLVWAMVKIWPHARWITLINIPYLLWVSFATILQLTITYLNY